MLDLDSLEIGVPMAATNLVFPRPLEPFHISMVKQQFEHLAGTAHWCGYAFLNSIPEQLHRNIMCHTPTDNIGVVMFSETPEQNRFIIRDIYENFRLLNPEGHTIFMSEHLDPVLDKFMKRSLA